MHSGGGVLTFEHRGDPRWLHNDAYEEIAILRIWVPNFISQLSFIHKLLLCAKHSPDRESEDTNKETAHLEDNMHG